MENHNFNEELTLRIKEKIDTAKANAILESRLEEIEKKMYEYSLRQDEEAHRQEDLIEQEILSSSAVANDLTEFREVLGQIKQEYEQTNEWAENMLVHENAHANVAEQTGHPWVGYTTLFIKDSNNRIVGIQPAFFTKSDRKWGKVETLMKRMAVTDAPRVYDNSPSEQDDLDLKKDNERLKEFEKTEAKEVARVRESLGLK
jgi:hypothetical protein